MPRQIFMLCSVASNFNSVNRFILFKVDMLSIHLHLSNFGLHLGFVADLLNNGAKVQTSVECVPFYTRVKDDVYTYNFYAPNEYVTPSVYFSSYCISRLLKTILTIY